MEISTAAYNKVLQYWGGRIKYCTFIRQKKAFVVGWADVQ